MVEPTTGLICPHCDAQGAPLSVYLTTAKRQAVDGALSRVF